MPVSISGSGTIGVGTGTAISIDASNRVITSSNKPMVCASMRTSGGGWTNYGADPGSIVIYNNIVVNNGNHYNSSTGIFTCPVAGHYRMMACVLAGQSNYSCHLRPRKNNVNILDQAAHINQLSGWVNIWAIHLVSCSANDTLSWYAASSGAGIYTISDYSHMIIELVG